MLLLASACASAAPGDAAAWDATTVWQGEAPLERVRIGRPDASDPDPQIVGVDGTGRLVLVRARAGDARVLYRHDGALAGLALADADPSVPGEEVYACGAGAGGGVVVQIAVDGERVATRTVLTAPARVQAIEALPPRAGERGARLLCGTRSGDLHVLACDAEGAWSERRVFRGSPGSEAAGVIDLAPLDGGARAFVVLADGRALDLDVVDPIASRFVAVDRDDRERDDRDERDADDRDDRDDRDRDDRGALARCVADAAGDVYAADAAGRVVRFTRRDGAWTSEIVARDGARGGLSGVALGRFPLADGSTAPLAILGPSASVRALAPSGAGWRGATLFRDDPQGRALAAGEIVPGNGADELVCAGTSGRVTLISAR